MGRHRASQIPGLSRPPEFGFVAMLGLGAWLGLGLLIGAGLLISAGPLSAAEQDVAEQAASEAVENELPADIKPADVKSAEPAEPNLAIDDPQRIGRFLTVSNPLTDRVRSRVQQNVLATLREAKQQNSWPVIVLELQPGRVPYGHAYELASFLSGPELTGATTVAYVPESIDGHSVLIALACDEIIMRPTAELGNAGKYDGTISPAIRAAYAEIAARRKNMPADLALALLDPALELHQVETDVSRELVLGSRLEELRQQKSFARSKVIVPAGSPGVFTGTQGRELGVVSYLANDRLELAGIWKFPREAMQDNPALGGQWRAARVSIDGPITGRLARHVRALILDHAQRDGVNLLVVTIDSSGGEPAESLQLANFLANLDSATIRTVAHIPNKASGDAVFVALACDEIVMQSEAMLGGMGVARISADEQRLMRIPAAELARQKLRSVAMAQALTDSSLNVSLYLNRENGRAEFFVDEELQQRADAKQWQLQQQVVQAGTPLKIVAQQALDWGVASNVVENFGELKSLYGLEHDPSFLEPNWAMTLIDALSSEPARWLLLFVGIVALFVELHTPGLGLGGIVGAMCFALYFWSAHLGGTAGWLEVILFAAGVICLLLELFVFPGVGVFGLSGGLMVIGSLVLASQTFIIPRDGYQLAQLRTSLLWLFGAGVAALAAMLFAKRYLPSSPVFNPMLLAPPGDEELSALASRESLAEFGHLLGASGTAQTPLYPAGKVQFGDELVDCMADGEFIERGQGVRVVQVRGNHVLVRALKPDRA